jgi:dihydropyrimidine dehydrogenase (NAD+) subunit PreA
MDFLGIQWENPLSLSSSPVTNSAEMIARAYDAGFAGAYYKTLNREDKFQISHPSPRLGVVHSHNKTAGAMGSGMDVGIQNMEQISDRPLADNLKDIEWLRKNYPTKVTAVSIMGYCDEDWDYLARAAEGAGAHLLELNFSCPQMARSDAGHHVGQQFGLIERYTAVVKRAVKIPVVAKLTPNITDMIPAALAAQAGGADAISTINTLKSISHIDLDSITLNPTPTIQGKSAISGFSGKGCRPFGLRFVSELAREKRLHIPISGMGGIYTWKDCAEYLAVGATNLQVTTSVMQHGNRVVEDMVDGLGRYMEKNGFTSLHQIVGRANQHIVQPSELDTTTEVVSVIDPNLCIGCGVCEVACRDGAAHAISLGDCSSTKKKVAKVDRSACVGCKLCQFVCPVGAISFETRPRIERPRFSK